MRKQKEESFQSSAVVEPKSVKENACQNGQCSERRALPTLRTLVLFFWCPFSELRDEIPTAFKQGNAGIKANDEGCFLKVLTSTQYTRLSLTHTPLLQTGPRTHQREAAVCIHTALMPFGFLV